MTTSPSLTVNLVSGLAGAGKSSVSHPGPTSWVRGIALVLPSASNQPAWAATTPSRRGVRRSFFFGKDLNAATLTANLDACLLTDREFIGGPIEWKSLADRFPAWELDVD